MAGLTKEQKKIIREIEKEAIDAGVDPDFAIALANLESTFQHIPAEDKKSTAFGPFQVNKATAEANGVDYDEMKKNPELAIKAGIKNIARHMNNPTFEGDPARIAAAHRYGENSEYAKTGDVSKIDSTLRDYLLGVAGHYPNEEFPETIATKKPEASAKAEEPAVDMGSVPLPTYDQAQDEASDRRLAAGEGALAGSFVGAVKVPAIGIYKKAYDYLHRAPQAQDVGTIIDAANKVNEAKAAAQTGAQGLTTAPAAPEPTGPNAKYTAKFGQGVQLTPAEIASATGMGKGDTEAWGLIKKAREANKKIEEMAGAGSYTLDPNRGLLIDTSVGGGARGTTKANVAPSLSDTQKAQALAEHEAWLNAQKAAGTTPSTAGKVLRTIAGSSPVKYGLAGTGIGYNLEDASQKFKKDDYLGGLASLGAAGASGATLIPKYAARANPAAVALTTGSQVYGDIKAGRPQEAAESGLTGLTALMPRIFGPLGAALYSRGLNEGEQEELERRRRLPPTLTRP